MKTQNGKAVIALMGEFSAGKSTLANLLIGKGRSPVKVTATQLPPVWFTYGEGDPIVVGLDGEEHSIPIEELENVPVKTTAYIRVFSDADILELMDILDMPGNSDPNMSPDVWQRAIHVADGVIWCSHATQAWRQSEAAVWAELPESLYQQSILLLTRSDKIVKDSDKGRVLKRVRSETDGLFRAVFPVSLLQATEAGDDRAKWEASGAEAFTSCLIDIVMGVDPQIADEPWPTEEARAAPLVLEPKVSATPAPTSAEGAVLPRRVATTGAGGKRRRANRPAS